MATQWNVELTAGARKSLRKITEPLLGGIVRAMAQLSEDPFPAGHKQLRGQAVPVHRIRVGDYRIVYEVDRASRTVLITRIRHRSEVYDGL